MCINLSVSCKSIVNNYFQCIAQFNNQDKSLCVLLYLISIFLSSSFVYIYPTFSLPSSARNVRCVGACVQIGHIFVGKRQPPLFKTMRKYLSYPSGIIFSLVYVNQIQILYCHYTVTACDKNKQNTNNIIQTW